MKAAAFFELEKAVRYVDLQWKLLADGVLDAEKDAFYTHKVNLYTPDFDELLAAITELQSAATRFQMYYHASFGEPRP